MFIEQISVFVENKKGSLAEVLNYLTEAKINLRAVTVADTTDFGILRIIVNDADGALRQLKDKGVTASKTEVIGCKLPDEVGTLNKVLATLQDEGIEVEYLYSYISGGEAYIILRVEDNQRAQSVLRDAGHTLMEQKDI